MKYKYLRNIIKPFTHILWPVTIINQSKFSESKAIYICNHYSFFDPVVMYTDLFTTKFNALMKSEMTTNHKFWGKVLMDVGGIPVKRGEPDLRAVKKCMTVLKNNDPLLIFPEGMRNKSGSKAMLEMKDGTSLFAIKTKSPVIPMMFYKPIRLFRRTYLMIGNPISLEEFYDNNTAESRDAATEKIHQSMVALRKEIDALVENKTALKALLKQQKAEMREIRKKNKHAKKMSRKAKKTSQDAVVEE